MSRGPHEPVGGVDGAEGLPEAAWAAALAGLPAMGPARLRALLGRWPAPEAWRRVEEGRAHGDPDVGAACRPDPGGVGRAWAAGARVIDPAGVWRRHVEAGVDVTVLGVAPAASPADTAVYPPALAADHEAPAVVFSRGDLSALYLAPTVAIIGTRRATRYGREVARQLARDLSSAGVSVVSGLALGIDGAAHEGALAAAGAPTVAVVGSGLDVVYPRAHARLWSEIGARGVLLGEAPLGAAPEPWRFPSRNRIIAALSRAVVVVESPHRGGSVHTVAAAIARSRPVLAVPGPVQSPTSELPNALLSEGCAPARDALDVLVALELASPRSPNRGCPGSGAASGSSAASALAGGADRTPGGGPTRTRPDPSAAAVLDAMAWTPVTLEELVERSGLSPGAVSVALAHLERDGWVGAASGRWERSP